MNGSERRAGLPTPRTLAGDTPNPGALELSLAVTLLPALGALSVARGVRAMIAGPRRPYARLLGAGEVVVGLGLAAAQRKRAWAVARLVVDALGFVTRAQGRPNPVALARRAAGVAADLYAVNTLAPAAEMLADRRRETPPLSRTVTIGRSAVELHRLWRDPAVQAAIWADFAEIAPVGDRLRWVLRAPGRLRFTTRIVEEREGELIRWRAEGAAPASEGMIRFAQAPGGRGVEAALVVSQDRAGAAFAHAPFRAVPRTGLFRVLGKFKALAETGQIPRLQPLPSARHPERTADARPHMERSQ